MRQAHKALFVAMLFGAAAAPLATHAATNDADPLPPSILAFDQKAADKSIVVDYAQLPSAGYVAVYKTDKSGKPTGEPLGYTKIEAGDHRQIKVPLAEKPSSGDRLWVALYKDSDKDPTFSPSKGDTPIWSKTELPPEGMIVVR